MSRYPVIPVIMAIWFCLWMVCQWPWWMLVAPLAVIAVGMVAFFVLCALLLLMMVITTGKTGK